MGSKIEVSMGVENHTGMWFPWVSMEMGWECGRELLNNAAKLICDRPHGSHSAPLLRQLHWLPITSGVQCKLWLLMYDVFHGTAPSYLTELCHVCNDDRLRSTKRGNFAVVRTRTMMADGAFTVAGPAAWNALPPELRNATSRTHISKLTCTVIILTTSYKFLSFCYICCTDDVL